MFDIGRYIVENRFFNNGGTNLHISLISLSQTHVNMSKIVLLWSLTLKTWVYIHYFVSYLQYWQRYDENRFFDTGDTNLHIKLSKVHVIMLTITLLWSLTLITWVYTSYFVSYLQYWLRYSEK